MLARGPRSEELASALPSDARVTDVFEAKEGFLLELNEPFWSRDDEAVRRAAAQIVFTLATLEEGKRITFFDGLVPGAIPARDGSPLDQPVTRADFGELRPWIEVGQPVAGAVVARSVPVRLQLRSTRRAIAVVTARGETIARRPVDEDDSLMLPLVNAQEGTISITTTTTGGTHMVKLPVRFPPR